MLNVKKQMISRPKPWAPEKTAIVIPCYNEAQRLPLETFLSFAKSREDVRLIFVDDGSKDETLSLLCGAIAGLPERVDALTMKQNGGKAEAVRQGLKFAASRGHKYVAFLDADLATPIDAILDFASVADRMEEIDIVFGSRKGGLGHRVYREAHRKVISLVCATLGRLATGLPISDTQCGAKLFRNTAQFARSLEQPFAAGWLFDVELFLRNSHPEKKQRKNFFEFPVIEWTEIPGSKIKSSDVIKSGFKMLGLISQQWRIREQYFRRADDLKISEYQTLRAGQHFSYRLLSDLPAFIDMISPGIILDLRKVETLDPSIFTALVETCDQLERDGLKVKIQLPDNSDIINIAKSTGLSSVVDCTKVIGAVDKLGSNARFEMVEV